ncbi:MAG: IgGFc-binding protein, partial [Candidatus Kapabacteria bacterium]|nr:IgGFc-binding protein [Candidatus Kapabacteria bacterium]
MQASHLRQRRTLKGYIIKKLLLILSLLFSAIGANAQLTNIGTDFLLCFPQNDDPIPDTSLHLILYATPSDGENISGYVEYWDKGIKINKSFSAVVGNIATIELPNYLQLDTFNIALKKGIRVHSDNKMTLYGLSYRYYTSDAFLCYPLNTLYTNYTVCSLENFFFNNTVGFSLNRYSNITIVADQDNTEITINPACPIWWNKKKKHEVFNITLNKDEAIQIIADITNFYDVSGSLIKSNKPIAVYSTHQRSSLVSKTNDVLIEQTPPIQALGNRYVFTPNFSYPNDNKSYGKIVANFDNTELELPDSNIIINKGEFFAFKFDSAFYFKSTRPVLACHISPSQNNVKRIGDPFLAILPTPQQWLSSYTVIAAPFNNFVNHYINLMISKSEYKAISLDGTLLPDNIFKPVRGGDYLWTRLEDVSKGVHNLKSEAKFGILVYGYGVYDSYGYTGGMALEHLDYLNDSISPSFDIDKCKQSILIKDDTISIFSGIEILKVIEKENIDFTYNKILKGDTNYLINYTIPDDRAYSKLVLMVEDIAGRRDTLRLNLKPRTVFFQGIKNNILRDTLYYTQDSLVKIKINNNGFDDENIKLSLKQNISFSMPSSDIKSLI